MTFPPCVKAKIKGPHINKKFNLYTIFYMEFLIKIKYMIKKNLYNQL